MFVELPIELPVELPIVLPIELPIELPINRFGGRYVIVITLCHANETLYIRIIFVQTNIFSGGLGDSRDLPGPSQTLFGPS